MMAQVAVKGFRANMLRRLLCFALFWHALDIIWVALFTVVYLMGVGHDRNTIRSSTRRQWATRLRSRGPRPGSFG